MTSSVISEKHRGSNLQGTLPSSAVRIVDLFPQTQPLDGEVKSLSNLRADAQAILSDAICPAWPSVKNEAWRYTSLSKFKGFGKPHPLKNDEIKQLIGEIEQSSSFDDGIILYIINGYQYFSTEIKNETISIIPIGESQKLVDMQDDLSENDDFSLVNLVALQGGFHIKINKSTDVPIRIIHVTTKARDQDDVETIINVASRNYIELAKGVSAQTSEIFMKQNMGEQESFSQLKNHRNQVTQIDLAQGSRMNYTRYHNDSSVLFGYGDIQIKQGRDSFLSLSNILIDGQLVRDQVKVSLQGTGAETRVYASILSDQQKHLDLSVIARHAEAHGMSRQNIYALTAGQGRAIFQGKIIVDPDAQKTDGHQLCRGLMLSEQSEFDAKPELEIYADDVKCSHGCTTSSIEDEHMFYLKARGISDKDARRLLCQGFLNESLSEIGDVALKAQIETQLLQRLSEVFDSEESL